MVETRRVDFAQMLDANLEKWRLYAAAMTGWTIGLWMFNQMQWLARGPTALTHPLDGLTLINTLMVLLWVPMSVWLRQRHLEQAKFWGDARIEASFFEDYLRQHNLQHIPGNVVAVMWVMNSFDKGLPLTAEAKHDILRECLERLNDSEVELTLELAIGCLALMCGANYNKMRAAKKAQERRKTAQLTLGLLRQRHFLKGYLRQWLVMAPV